MVGLRRLGVYDAWEPAALNAVLLRKSRMGSFSALFFVE